MRFVDSGHVGHCFFNAIEENRLMDAADYLAQMLQRRVEEYAGNTEAMKAFILSHLVIGFDLAGKLEMLNMDNLEKKVDREARAYKSVYSASQDGVTQMMRNIMQEIIDLTGAEAEPPGSLPDEIRHYVRVNYSDPNLSVSSISERFGVSVSHLSRLFKKDSGMKLNDYIRGERISRAQTLLRMTDMSVQEIAGLVGFNSASAFIRAYREKMGISPGAYREQIQNGRSE